MKFLEKLLKELNDSKTTDAWIVDIVIHDFKNLYLMKPTSVDLIVMLENCNFCKDVCILRVLLLKGRIQFKRILKLIRNYAADKESIPCSLRVDIKLNPAMASMRRNQEFLVIKDKAKALTEHLQKDYKNLFLGKSKNWIEKRPRPISSKSSLITS